MTGRLPSKLSDYAGLTLVEILVALTLVAVVLLPVMIGLSQALGRAIGWHLMIQARR